MKKSILLIALLVTSMFAEQLTTTGLKKGIIKDYLDGKIDDKEFFSNGYEIRDHYKDGTKIINLDFSPILYSKQFTKKRNITESEINGDQIYDTLVDEYNNNKVFDDNDSADNLLDDIQYSAKKKHIKETNSKIRQFSYRAIGSEYLDMNLSEKDCKDVIDSKQKDFDTFYKTGLCHFFNTKSRQETLAGIDYMSRASLIAIAQRDEEKAKSICLTALMYSTIESDLRDPLANAVFKGYKRFFTNSSQKCEEFQTIQLFGKE